MDNVSTMFASAERADENSLLLDELLEGSELADHLSNVIPFVVMILNHQRQIVYASNKLMEMLGGKPKSDILGKRPGELLKCEHSDETPGGCGTTEFCRQCGAVRAILKSQDSDMSIEEECRIVTKDGKAFDFRVWASRYKYHDKEFTIFSVIDISAEKRRGILERTFFHDINNTVSTINNYTGLFKSSKKYEKFPHYADVMQKACKRLMDEVESQRKLLAAESGDLIVDISVVHTQEILADIISSFLYYDGSHQEHIIIDDQTEGFDFDSDYSLLSRILTNMLKNAVEASTEGQTVTVKCTKGDKTAVFSVHNESYIPRDIQLQIFERSFSTKGCGRGIGTYSIKLFAEHYLNGNVWFETAEYTGTTFYVAFPLSIR